jgi:thioredoxin-like negative regulator of GroEL
MIVERFVILIVVLLLCAAALAGWRLLAVRRLRQLATRDLPPEVADLVPSGPALLYFTTVTCAQCRLQQTPILKQLAASTNVPIHTVDAVEHERLARFFGIMTVPTTVWLDQTRRPAAMNHGLANLTQLRQQAAEIYAV